MALFRSTLVPLNFSIEGVRIQGPVGTVFDIPDELAPALTAQSTNIPGFEWVRQSDFDFLDVRITTLESSGGGHPTLAVHDTMGLATDAALDAHEAAADPHIQYTLSTELNTHAAAADPHTGYQRESEKGLASGYAALDVGGTVPDAQIPATIARDSELPDLAGHVASGDPHTAYALDSDLTTHAAAADPHTGYQKESEKAAVSGYASLDAGTKVPIAQVPTGATAVTVALGDAAAALDATHAAAVDPHTGYRLETADHSHASTGLQAGVVAHSALTGLTNDEHTQYQKESEKAAANGYASLDAGSLVPFAQHGTGTADGTKFLRDDRVWITPTSAPAPDSRLVVAALASNQADITGITLVELAGLTVACGIGTWSFEYKIIYQTTALTTGVEFVVDHTGTDTAFVSNMAFGSGGGAAATGTADQVGVGTAAGLVEVKTQRVAGARPGVTLGVDTINADMLMQISGVIVVSVAGNLQIFMAAELAALVCRAMKGSNLVLIKAA